MSEIRLDRWSLRPGDIPCLLYSRFDPLPQGMLGRLLTPIVVVTPKREAVQFQTVGAHVARALLVQGEAQ